MFIKKQLCIHQTQPHFLNIATCFGLQRLSSGHLYVIWSKIKYSTVVFTLWYRICFTIIITT